MSVPSNQTLALIEVARLIFRTKSPTEAQVARVQKLMKSGLLLECQCVGPPAQWTTTAGAIADYLAKESLKRQTGKQTITDSSAAPVPSIFEDRVYEPDNSAQLKSLYKGIWSDYFLTVFMQRKTVNHSAKFKQAVLAGQVVLLVGLIFAMLSVVKLSTVAVPPEHAIVERWIDEHTDSYTVRKWYPIVPAKNGEGAMLRVEYSYKSENNPKMIITDRRFIVVGDQAKLVVEDD